MKDFHDKVALVTGAGSGIGRATARALAREGCQLVLCDANSETLFALANELGQTCCLLAETIDVASREAMRAFAERVHERVPALDLLVNNAGVGLAGGILDTPLEDWDWVVGVNLFGVIHGCHFFIPKMVTRGAGGHVVNISSAAGYFAPPEMAGYATTKFAVLGLSEALRADLARHRIGVTTVCPGVVRTGIIRTTRFFGTEDSEAVRERVDRLYQRRNYGPERVAKAIVDGIRTNRALLPVTPEAWALYYMKRLTPALSPILGRLLSAQGH